VESAEAAGLRYVSDTMPGIRRKKAGTGFSYVGPDGKVIKDPGILTRMRSLAIPPAYTDVWICPSPNGHIQATGRDARHRKQYRYHPRWREVRDETKFGRVLAFSQVLPRLRRQV
jgi:DNA topoisomerase-1